YYPRGYCKGVTKAIQAVKNACADPSVKKPIYVLGYIVHNHHVIDELNEMGVITLDDLNKSRIDLIDEIDHGTVVLSAHGTDSLVKQKLIERHLDVIDATCEDVEKTFELIKKHINLGYQIIYIGKSNHPETNAALSISKDIRLVEHVEDIPEDLASPVFVTNQTTFSMIEIKEIIDRVIELYPDTLISEEICNATRLRQSAIIEQNIDVDLCYIVGDIRSNNTKNLAIISEKLTHTKTKLIDSVNQINALDLKGVSTVSVSSGASTPNRLTKEVIEYLKKFPDGK
ncbi:MAG TPA: 4-hydroxy-3-methylbut-2-enyl diphosphate reductase, partial [Bacillota bacterium]|nr:4-hydroxy-3-methylbut-2-enyl diphosphate reductase [Bacillota bacterium]